MSNLPTTLSRRRLTVLSAVVALAASGVVASNLAGAASGPSAVDYSQCSNVVPAGSTSPCVWINGILNNSNSDYHEDEATPQRLTVTVVESSSNPTNAHYVDLKYLDRKGTIHAYDALTDANLTITHASDDAIRCQALGTIPGVCPSAAVSDVQPVVHDTTVMNGTVGSGGNGDNTVSTHEPTGDKLRIFGATFGSPAMEILGHDNNCSGCTGDDYATARVYFKTPTGDNKSSHNVQLLFGGHLAPGGSLIDGWGDGLGSSSVSGGPYHIKWVGADGSSVGNRDNQIMSGAITIVAQGTGVPTTPSLSLDSTDGHPIASDSVTLDPSSGVAPTGTVSFDLYGPFTTASPPTSGPPSNCDPTATTGNRKFHVDSLSVPTTAPYTVSSGNVNISSYAPGTYQWIVSYSGDTYNLANAGLCGDSSEQFTIPAGASSQTLTDTVTVSGNSPTGSVSFSAYTTSDCTTGKVFGPNTQTLTGGSATSDGFTPSPAATTGTTYYWLVTYSGDSHNSGGIVEACGVQRATIRNAS